MLPLLVFCSTLAVLHSEKDVSFMEKVTRLAFSTRAMGTQREVKASPPSKPRVNTPTPAGKTHPWFTVRLAGGTTVSTPRQPTAVAWTESGVSETTWNLSPTNSQTTVKHSTQQFNHKSVVSRGGSKASSQHTHVTTVTHVPMDTKVTNVSVLTYQESLQIQSTSNTPGVLRDISNLSTDPSLGYYRIVGDRDETTDNFFTARNVSVLSVAVFGALILLTINCAGLFCCQKYFKNSGNHLPWAAATAASYPRSVSFSQTSHYSRDGSMLMHIRSERPSYNVSSQT